jgi:hypothetical protein
VVKVWKQDNYWQNWPAFSRTISGEIAGAGCELTSAELDA